MKKCKIIIIALILCGNFITHKVIAFGKDTTIKTIAILPFTISIDTNNLKNGVTKIGIMKSSDRNCYLFQRALHTWFMKKPQNYNVVFPDIMTINDLLKQDDLADSTNVFTKQKLCNALGVDAIIFGNVQIIKPREMVGYEVMRKVVGIDVSPGDKINLQLNLYNSDGKVLWNQTYKGYGNASADVIIDKFLRRTSKTFPFKK